MAQRWFAKKSKRYGKQMPKSFLAATASKNAYIAKCAVQDLELEPKELFGNIANSDDSKMGGVSTRLRRATFQYVSPKDLNYELPILRKPEVAFIGRSNVGKSSLINALSARMQRTKDDLAVTSKTPGRTQQIGYFAIMPNNNKKINSQQHAKNQNAFGYLIDLPGYGWANAPPKAVEQWSKTTQDFLAGRDVDVLRRVYLLVDGRVGLQELDVTIMGWLDDLQLPYTICVTKADRVSKSEIILFVNELCMRYQSQLHGCGGYQGPIIHVTSSKSDEGVRELLSVIDAEFKNDPLQYFGLNEQDESEDLLEVN